MHYGWASPYLPELESGNYTFQITSGESSFLAVIPLIGAIFGAVIAALTVDLWGRKTVIVFSSIPFIVSWLLVGVATSATLLFVGRFIGGVCDGVSLTVAPMYLGEIAEPKLRGLLASICPLAGVLALLLMSILGAYLPLDTVAFIAMAIPFVMLIALPWMPESPYSYLMWGKQNKARKSLQIFRGYDDVDEELDLMTLAVKEQNETKGKFFELFTVKSNRKGLFVALGR